MPTDAVVVRESEREWESWPDDQRGARGEVRWKTLVSGAITDSDSLTLGLARLGPGERLREHRHPQAEAYILLEGELTLTVGTERHVLTPGACAWVRGGAWHSCANEGGSETRFAYAFAADDAGEIGYEFSRE